MRSIPMIVALLVVVLVIGIIVGVSNSKSEHPDNWPTAKPHLVPTGVTPEYGETSKHTSLGSWLILAGLCALLIYGVVTKLKGDKASSDQVWIKRNPPPRGYDSRFERRG